MRTRKFLRAVGRTFKALGRIIERQTDCQAYERSLRAGVAGRGQQIFYEKELFGVDTGPDYLRPDRGTPRR